jgi:hypothetical protein
MVNRRTAIRQFLFVSAGIVLVQACNEEKNKASIILKNMEIDANQEGMLGELTETIIPKTNTPGAKDISAHLFVLKMVDDCFKNDDRQSFVNGLVAFENRAKAKFGTSFSSLKSSDREQFLTEMESKKDSDEVDVKFYKTTKQLTIRAYTTSQFYLTNVQVYKLIPGPYSGCVPVNYLKNNS